MGKRVRKRRASLLLPSIFDCARFKRAVECELAGKEGCQRAGVSLDCRGRGFGVAPAELKLAAGDADAEVLLAEPQLVARLQLARGLGVEERAQGEDDRVGADLTVLGRGRRPRAPGAQLGHYRLQLGTPLGQLVDMGRRRRGQFATMEYTDPLELAQTLGEDVGACVGQPVTEVGEALRAEQQLAHDEKAPNARRPGRGRRRSDRHPRMSASFPWDQFSQLIQVCN